MARALSATERLVPRCGECIEIPEELTVVAAHDRDVDLVEPVGGQPLQAPSIGGGGRQPDPHGLWRTTGVGDHLLELGQRSLQVRIFRRARRVPDVGPLGGVPHRDRPVPAEVDRRVRLLHPPPPPPPPGETSPGPPPPPPPPPSQ